MLENKAMGITSATNLSRKEDMDFKDAKNNELIYLELLEKYRERLLNLTTRNIALKLGSTNKSKFWDIANLLSLDKNLNDWFMAREGELIITSKNFLSEDLFNGTNSEEIRQELINKSKEDFNVFKKCINSILKNTNAIMKETGKFSLYCAFMFLEGRFSNGKGFRAPIFLFPLSIKIDKSNVIISHDKALSVVLNRTLFLALEKFEGIANYKDDFELDSLAELSVNSIEDTILLIKNTGLVLKDSDLKLYKLNKYSEKDWLYSKSEFCVKNHAIIGVFDLTNSVYLDYEKLKDRRPTKQLDLLLQLSQSKDNIIKDVKSKINTLPNRPNLGLISNLDTSQELAVYKSSKCDNLVIYGPPGTGKSEVILNIVTDNLSSDRKVLVVSEKKTALDVIYNRLGNLNSLALLFSGDIDKKEIEKKILNKVRVDYDLQDLESKLDNYSDDISDSIDKFNRLHHILTSDTSIGVPLGYLYKLSKNIEMQDTVAISALLTFNSDKYEPIKSVSYMDLKDKLNKILEFKMFDNYNLISDNIHLLDLIENLNKISKLDTFNLINKLNSIISKNNHLDNLKSDLENTLSDNMCNIAKNINNVVDEYIKNNNNSLFIKYQELSTYLIDKSFAYESIEKLQSVIELELGYTYDTTLESSGLYLKLIELCGEDLGSGLSEINYFIKDYIESNHTDLVNRINELNKWSIKKLFHWKENTEELRLKQKELNALMQNYYKDCNKIIEIHNKNLKILKRLDLEVNRELEGIKGNFENIKKGILSKFDEIGKLEGEIKDEINCVIDIINCNTTNKLVESEDINLDCNRLLGVLTNTDKYRRLINQINSIGDTGLLILDLLSNLNKELKISDINELKDILEKTYLFIAIDSNNELTNEIDFLLENYSNYIENYKKAINDKNKGIEKLIVAKREENLKSMVDTSLDYLYFNKEIVGKNRQTLRKLMGKYFKVINTIFPVFLMTPETVSKYLPFEKELFDIVIFDEASQVVVENSLPAIFRGKKVVVVGDDKQLKPSNQFNVSIDNTEDDSNSDDVDKSTALGEDSLLDLAKINYDSVTLLYHYRSKYNELINFSNYAFYGGQLRLAPNVIKSSEYYKPIEYLKVKGVWHNNANEIEAKKVVELLYNTLKERRNNETIGIITFNSKQKECIESVIDSFKLVNEEFCNLVDKEENRVDNGEDKSLFIKNIENVQGDERDIIIFSVGYAKDNLGILRCNFGTLNKQFGENRLNVAISRAKIKIYIVASIEAEDLNIDMCKNIGPKLLKDYLKYARAVSSFNKDVIENLLYGLTHTSNKLINVRFDSPFEEQVYTALVNEGLTVDTQVGVMGYRIDLAIYDDVNRCYIAGIECDGATYHSSKDARERDINRQKFLESKGWTIIRVWSTNWWKNSNTELRRILCKLDEIRNDLGNKSLKEDLFIADKSEIDLSKISLSFKDNEKLDDEDDKEDLVYVDIDLAEFKSSNLKGVDTKTLTGTKLSYVSIDGKLYKTPSWAYLCVRLVESLVKDGGVCLKDIVKIACKENKGKYWISDSDLGMRSSKSIDDKVYIDTHGSVEVNVKRAKTIQNNSYLNNVDILLYY